MDEVPLVAAAVPCIPLWDFLEGTLAALATLCWESLSIKMRCPIMGEIISMFLFLNKTHKWRF